MHRALIAFLLVPLAALVVASCVSPLGAFNALTPADPGIRRIATGAAYGDGPGRTLDVYAPQKPARGDLPLLIFIHGGSWASGERAEYGFVGRAFAARGFVAIVPNYRLVPEVRFPDFLDDCAEAIAYARAHASSWGADPDRIVLVGHSAGAYNAVMLALDPRYLERAGAPMESIKGVAGLAGPYDFLPLDLASTINAFGQAPDLAETQPVHFARAGAAPLFLAWGEKDTTVRRRSIVNLQAAMRAAGGEAEIQIYPNLDHVGILLALSRPLRGKANVLGDVAGFAQRVTSD